MNVELKGQKCSKGLRAGLRRVAIVRVKQAYFVDVYVVSIFPFD